MTSPIIPVKPGHKTTEQAWLRYRDELTPKIYYYLVPDADDIEPIIEPTQADKQRIERKFPCFTGLVQVEDEQPD